MLKEVYPAMSYDASQDPRYYDKYSSRRTDLSRRREQEQISQRQRNGDLAPGQRSLNEPWRD